MRKVLVLALVSLTAATSAQAGSRGGRSEDRWNVTGPNWYETPCGHIGFSLTHGLPYQNWRKPCSVPIRVCEYKNITVNFPADPDVPCEKMMSPATAGELQRTYIKRWD